MTTSHKPTYHPAIGRVHAGGYRFDARRAQFSSRELPAHMTLKQRHDLKHRDQEELKRALFDAERNIDKLLKMVNKERKKEWKEEEGE